MVIAKGVVIKSAAALITIGGAVSTGIVLHRTGQFESARDVLIKGRFWGLNGEDKFGIPNECEKGECELSEEKLKKVKFRDLEGSSGDFSFEGLKDKKIKFRFVDEVKNQSTNKWYVFDNKDNESEVKINRGEKTLTLAKNTDSYFRGEGSNLVFVVTKLGIERKEKMEEVNGELVRLGLGGLKLEERDFEEESIRFKKEMNLDVNKLKNVKFKELDGGASRIIKFNSGEEITIELQYNEDAERFPKNMKFTFRNNTNYEIELSNTTTNKNIKIVNITGGKGNNEIFKSLDGKLARAQ